MIFQLSQLFFLEEDTDLLWFTHKKDLRHGQKCFLPLSFSSGTREQIVTFRFRDYEGTERWGLISIHDPALPGSISVCNGRTFLAATENIKLPCFVKESNQRQAILEYLHDQENRIRRLIFRSDCTADIARDLTRGFICGPSGELDVDMIEKLTDEEFQCRVTNDLVNEIVDLQDSTFYSDFILQEAIKNTACRYEAMGATFFRKMFRGFLNDQIDCETAPMFTLVEQFCTVIWDDFIWDYEEEAGDYRHLFIKEHRIIGPN